MLDVSVSWLFLNKQSLFLAYNNLTAKKLPELL